ncbi:COX15/CtaA family protein [Candidatus Paracaedibacter symbiosus]|uniref:COX15/CtaA family protein n=1 Tax=Candidatus Paracaedibacter symbiosus TaxID=244582 RepID=UPI00094E18A5|nr:COX15/CtaA family protein [Candidatus Paracaedibacter symbiosus]
MNQHTEMNTKQQLIWLFGTCFLIWLMIMLGGATRLTHSGLSIVEWKPVTGILPPLSEGAWQDEFTKYQQFPEYKLVNSDMALSEFKFIFFMEYAHRLLGRLIGLVFFIPLIYFWGRGRLSPFVKKMSLAAMVIGAGQGFMGWYMVKSGLVKDPAVSHYRLATHLLLAMVLYAMLFWTGLKVWHQRPKTRQPQLAAVTGILHLGSLFLILTIFYGALVAGLKAGLIYNTFPLMEGSFIPSEWNFLQPIYLNFFENAAMVQWIHRYLAILTFVFLAAGMALLMRKEVSESLRYTAALVIAGVFLQALLGIMTLLHQVPVLLGTLHQGTAVVVLTLVLYVKFAIYRES